MVCTLTFSFNKTTVARTYGVGFRWDLVRWHGGCTPVLPCEYERNRKFGRFKGISSQRYISALWVGVECTSGVWRWIWMKFGGVHGECVLMLPCENELNRRGSKNSCFWGEHKNKCNLDALCWIWIKFGRINGECVLMLPCENELNRRHVAFWWQLKGI